MFSSAARSVYDRPRGSLSAGGVQLTEIRDLERNLLNNQNGAFIWNANYRGSPTNPFYAAYSLLNQSGDSLDRFEIRNGDVSSSDLANNHIFERSQYGTLDSWNAGVDFWTSFQMYVVPGGVPSQGGNVIWGLPPHPDPLDQLYSSQVIGSFYNNQFLIDLWYSTENPLVDPSTQVRIYQGAIPTGRWASVVQHVKFGASGGGVLEVWLDGTKIVSYSGQIGLASAATFSFKWGQYRGTAPASGNGQSIMWFFGVEYGTTDLSARITSPKTPPVFTPS